MSIKNIYYLAALFLTGIVVYFYWKKKSSSHVPQLSHNPCYCKSGQEFCGKCDDCGKSGHTQPGPGIPVTGAWCDECFQNYLTS
jgi:hypothetical protein